MWITIPATPNDTQETINFNKVKEFYVTDNLLYIVQDQDAENDNINWFKYENNNIAKEVESNIIKILGTHIIKINTDNKTIVKTAIDNKITPTV